VLPLPISRTSFEGLRTMWRLPTEFLRMLLSTMPIASEFSSMPGDANGPMEGNATFVPDMI
jgi:hypothetical protein